MKKAMLAMVCLSLMLTCAVGASAAPYITNGEYSSYIGENNHLFLIDPAGGAKVLRAAIVDLIGMNDTEMYCLTAEGRLYAIKLDGSSTRIVSAAPTEADLAAVAPKPNFTLENGVLSLLSPLGVAQPIMGDVLMAADNGLDVYFITKGTPNQLCRVSLTEANASVSIICDAVDAPVSLIATEDTVTMLAGDKSIILVNLQDNSRRYEAPTSADTAAAVAVGGILYRYTQDENGRCLLETMSDSGLTLVDRDAPTATPTASPTPTPTPTPRPTPTKTPRPTASPTPEDDGSIRYGDRGSDVKKMQKRLLELGYPVGKADGVFGDNTLVGLNLFQGNVDYRERDRATESLLNRLYRKDAPYYDQTAPLEKGDSGMAVKLMQQALQDQGFGPAKVDGIYGNDTRKAVRLFQQTYGLRETGKADRDTLAKLYRLPEIEFDETIGTHTDLVPHKK